MINTKNTAVTSLNERQMHHMNLMQLKHYRTSNTVIYGIVCGIIFISNEKFTSAHMVCQVSSEQKKIQFNDVGCILNKKLY